MLHALSKTLSMAMEGERMKESRKDTRGRVLREGESQRKDGSYEYKYRGADGRRHSVYAATLKELREKRKQAEKDVEDGILHVKQNIVLNDVFDIYFSGKKELKESTLSNYKYMYDKYVRVKFGKQRINLIRYSDVRKFYNHLIDDLKFKPNSLETIHSLLHPTFTLAVRDGYIRSNPSDGLMGDIKKSHCWEKPQRHALTEAEQEAFVRFVSMSPIYSHWMPLFTFLLGTGCRIGETIGLRWVDCDFENNEIFINHNVIYRFRENDGCRFRITTPKTTAGNRVVPMLSEVKEALLREREEQKHLKLKSPVVDGYSHFVFLNRENNLHNPMTINRVIKRIIRDHNREEVKRAETENRQPFLIRDFSVHNLRHTFCTRFCENETNLKVIQDIMGHSDISTTMNIYAEATAEKKRNAFVNLEGKLRIS